MKWLSPYTRRLVRKMIKEKKRKHKGYRYTVFLDDQTNLIYIVDKKTRKRHVLLKG